MPRGAAPREGPPAVLLMGPTASGKTDLAVRLVERFPLEIVSVDSAMVYRGMDIGTAKPSPAILARAPHRLIDILDPAESYSAGRFRRDALREMRAIVEGGKVPLLVGGTMLYFRALREGLAPLPSADPKRRAGLDARARQVGWPALHAELAEVDPAAAARIHPNDAQRIQRALEVYHLTGRALSDLQAARAEKAPYVWLKLALAPPDRDVLKGRIERRFANMMAQGFLDEVRALHRRGDLDRRSPSMRAVGYRQLWDHLEGLMELAAAQKAALAATRNLAKRQLTWLRAESEVVWLDSEDPSRYTRSLEQVSRLLASR